MANLKILEASSGSETPLEDVDLSITNKDLIDGLIDGGVLRSLTGGQQHLLVGNDNSVSSDTKSLQELGFTDGDTIKVVTKDVGA